MYLPPGSPGSCHPGVPSVSRWRLHGEDHSAPQGKDNSTYGEVDFIHVPFVSFFQLHLLLFFHSLLLNTKGFFCPNKLIKTNPSYTETTNHILVKSMVYMNRQKTIVGFTTRSKAHSWQTLRTSQGKPAVKAPLKRSWDSSKLSSPTVQCSEV